MKTSDWLLKNKKNNNNKKVLHGGTVGRVVVSHKFAGLNRSQRRIWGCLHVLSACVVIYLILLSLLSIWSYFSDLCGVFLTQGYQQMYSTP